MKFCFALGLVSMLALSAAARAEDVKADETKVEAPAKVAPCSRSSSSMMIAGVDVDEMKCKLAVLEASQAETSSAMVGLQAKKLMLQSDLDTARKGLAQKQEAVMWWSRCVKDQACRDWAAQ